MKCECHTDRIQKSIEMRFLFPYTKIPVRAVQGRRKLYYGRALSKIIGHHGWPPRQQKLAKNLTCFTKLNSLIILKNMYSHNTGKNMFLLGARKNICTAPFLGTQ